MKENLQWERFRKTNDNLLGYTVVDNNLRAAIIWELQNKIQCLTIFWKLQISEDFERRKKIISFESKNKPVKCGHNKNQENVRLNHDLEQPLLPAPFHFSLCFSFHFERHPFYRLLRLNYNRPTTKEKEQLEKNKTEKVCSRSAVIFKPTRPTSVVLRENSINKSK